MTRREQVLTAALALAIEQIAARTSRSEAWVQQMLLAQATDGLRAKRLSCALDQLDFVINGEMDNAA